MGKYNKDTYIGHFKLKNGGMKIIDDSTDKKILKNRNKILKHLEKVLTGGKSLKDKNIEKYFKALDGKYIRNEICTSGESRGCKKGQNVVIGGAHKLLKLAAKNNLDLEKVLNKFKGSAPTLYKKLENKISGGNNNNLSEGGYSEHSSYGGEKPTTSTGSIFVKESSNYSLDFRNIATSNGLAENAILEVEFFTKNPIIRDQVIENLEKSLRAGVNKFTTQGGAGGRTMGDFYAFSRAIESKILSVHSDNEFVVNPQYSQVTTKMWLIVKSMREALKNTKLVDGADSSKVLKPGAIADNKDFINQLQGKGLNALVGLINRNEKAGGYDVYPEERYSEDRYSRGGNDRYSEDRYSRGGNERYSEDRYSRDDNERYSRGDNERYSRGDNERYSRGGYDRYPTGGYDRYDYPYMDGGALDILREEIGRPYIMNGGELESLRAEINRSNNLREYILQINI